MKFRTRVFLGGLLIALISAVFTGLLIRNRTIRAVEEAAQANLDVDRMIYDDLFYLGFDRNDWSESQADVDSLSETYDRRIAIVDLDGVILADSDPGQPLPKEPAALLDAGFLLSTDIGLMEEDPDVFCAEAIGAEQISECMDAFFELTQDLAFPEGVGEGEGALLYLGYSAGLIVDQGTFSLATIATMVALVLVVSALAAALIAGPMTRPVGELTAAVHELKAGDLTKRVDGTGSTEMAELANGFNALALRLQQSDKARRQMVSDVAHELRNPVGVMQSNLEAAQDGLFPTDSALVELLHSETIHLAKIITDLSQLAQSDAGELTMDLVIADLHQVAAEVIEVAAPSASVGGVSFSLVGKEALCLADHHRVRQVVANLVSNAVRHSPDGGVITVSVDSTADGAWLEVSDEGEGLTPEEAERVFDRFWRADSARASNTGGAGLGLAICRSLIEAQGGTIEAAYGPGGARFRFDLPVGRGS